MPIEIKELHIKAIVGNSNREKDTKWLKQEDISKLKKEISKEVTEKLIKMLKQKNER